MNAQIVEAFERLKAEYPTEEVELQVRKIPGEIHTRYVACVGNVMDGRTYGFAKDAIEAAEKAIKSTGKRDPESIRKGKIAKLQEQIDALKAVETGVVAV